MTQQELELPKGWVSDLLTKIFYHVPTGIKNFDGLKDYYSTGSIKNLKITSEGKFDFNQKPSRANRLAKKNDVFQARMAQSEKSLLVNDDFNENLFSTGFLQFRVLAECSPKYLFYLLSSGIFLTQRDKFSTGSTQKALTDSGLKRIVIPLAPLKEQEKIASKIEELFSKVDSTKQSLEYTKLQLVQYKHSLLKSAFEGKLTEKWREENYDSPTKNQKIEGLPNEWKLVTTDKVGDIITGNTPSTKEAIFYGNDVPFFKPTDLNSGYYVKDSKEKLSKKGIQKARQIPEKSVLVTSIGATIGKTGFNRIAGATNQQINSIIPITNIILPEYLYFICISPQFQKSILDNSSATTLPIINKSKFSKLKIPLPSIEEQEQIVSQIEQGFTLIENSQRIINSTLQTLETLRISILKQAFEGKLVPQDPNDEPAEILLEQIKKEREALMIKNKLKRGGRFRS